MLPSSKVLVTGLVCLAIGSGLWYWLVPVKVVEKRVEVVKTVTKVDKVTTTTKRPDGTIITVEVDKSKIDEASKTESSKSVMKENKNWLVGASTTFDLDGRVRYEGSLQRRVLGEIYVGVFGASDGRAGVGLSFRF